MDEMTVRVLSDLARLYDNRSKDASEEDTLYYQGGAAALRHALTFLAGPVPLNGHGRAAAAEESMPCPDCGKEFKSKQAIGAHRFRMHGVRSEAAQTKPPKHLTAGKFACKECGKTYEYIQHLGAHMKRVHGQLSQRDLRLAAVS